MSLQDTSPPDKPFSVAGLADKVVVVTGAARGQGAEEAQRFVDAGAKVVLTDLEGTDGPNVAATLGAAAVFVSHDVGDEASWKHVMDTATATFGGIDVLVNNAGIWRTTTIEDETVENFERILRVNLLGTFLGIRSVIAPMRARGGGSIVNISSTAGMQGYRGHAAYSSSKWGVRGLTKVAAIELGADQIRVNSVHPGAVATPMIESTRTADAHRMAVPLGRIGQSNDIAGLVLFLASDASSFMTGAELVIDGGAMAGK